MRRVSYGAVAPALLATPAAAGGGTPIPAPVANGLLVLAALLILAGVVALLVVIGRRRRHGQAFIRPYREAGAQPPADTPATRPPRRS